MLIEEHASSHIHSSSGGKNKFPVTAIQTGNAVVLNVDSEEDMENVFDKQNNNLVGLSSMSASPHNDGIG